MNYKIDIIMIKISDYSFDIQVELIPQNENE
jgi:hypothetical protein